MAEADGTATADTSTTTAAPAKSSDEAAEQQPGTETKKSQTTETSTEETGGSEQDNSQDTKVAGKQDDKTEAEGEPAAEKQEAQVRYQLRQIRNNDQYVGKLRSNLEENYVNEVGITPEEARVRKVEAEQYVDRVTRSRAELVADNDRVAQDISLFNPSSKDFNKPLLDRSLARYARDQLERDSDGEIIGYKLSLYDYMREEADAYYAGSSSAKDKQSQATAKMDASAESPGKASPSQTEAKKTPFDDAFEAGFNSVK